MKVRCQHPDSRIRLRSAAILALALGLAGGSLRSSDGTAENAPNPLDPLASLVGTVWRAEFPGGKLTDTQEFEWMFGGKFIRNVHRVADLEGKVVYEGETIYAWDRESESILWWYFNSTGGHVIGDAHVDGRVITVSGVNHGGGDQTSKVRGRLEIGDGHWISTSFFWTDEQWKERFTMRFVPLEDPTGP